MRLALALIASVFVALAGGATDPPHIIPTPAVFKDPRLDFVPQVPEARRTTHVPVFYATTPPPSANAMAGSSLALLVATCLLDAWLARSSPERP
jgi:hypothetical protein